MKLGWAKQHEQGQRKAHWKDCSIRWATKQGHQNGQNGTQACSETLMRITITSAVICFA